MKKRKVSIIIFYTDDKKILLQDRTWKKNALAHWWYFWWWIEDGETKEEALVREVKEELTYDLKDYKYIWNYKNIVLTIETEVELFVFTSRLIDINEFEQKEWKWMWLFTIDEAKKLDMTKELDYEVLNMLEKELNN